MSELQQGSDAVAKRQLSKKWGNASYALCCECPGGFGFSITILNIKKIILAKESEDKENLPKRTSAGGFKFTFSHSASATNGANSTNSKSVAAQTSPASSNGSSSKNANLTAAVTATKVS